MENKLIKLTPSISGFEVAYNNGVMVGRFELGDDGYFTYWPLLRPGCWPSEFMREIADTLDDLNKEWDAQVQNDLNKGWDEQIKKDLG